MARCAQTTCPQHLYREPALRRMCTRPMAPHLTGPPRSLTTANCSVAPKSTKPCNHARPGRQASGCKARWGGHLGMQKSLNTPHPAGLECRPSQVQVSAGLGQRTWRHQWRPTQDREISPPLPLLLSSFCLVFMAGPGTEVQPVPGCSPGWSQRGGKEAGEEGPPCRVPGCEGGHYCNQGPHGHSGISAPGLGPCPILHPPQGPASSPAQSLSATSSPSSPR